MEADAVGLAPLPPRPPVPPAHRVPAGHALPLGRGPGVGHRRQGRRRDPGGQGPVLVQGGGAAVLEHAGRPHPQVLLVLVAHDNHLDRTAVGQLHPPAQVEEADREAGKGRGDPQDLAAVVGGGHTGDGVGRSGRGRSHQGQAPQPGGRDQTGAPPEQGAGGGPRGAPNTAPARPHRRPGGRPGGLPRPGPRTKRRTAGRPTSIRARRATPTTARTVVLPPPFLVVWVAAEGRAVPM